MSSANANPSGWARVRLGDVGQWYGGGTPSKFEPRFWTSGTIPWVSPKDMKSLQITDSEDHLSQAAIEETNVREFPRGTVLLVIRSGILSRTLPVGVAHVPGTMNQDLKGVRPAKGIESMFLAYQLIGREREVLNKCSKHGTTVASIDTERLHDFEIRLAPTPEQHRIVAKIEELLSDLNAGVAALERVRANLKRYRAAVLKAAVEGRLTENWRTRNPAIEPAAKLLERILAERRANWEQDQLRKFKEARKTPPKGWGEKYEAPQTPGAWEGANLPRTWTLASIDQLSVVVRGGSPRPAGDPKYFCGTHTPWITVGTLTADDGVYLHAVSEYLTEAGRERSRYIEPDTLLLTNSGATLGVPKITMIGGCINDGSVALLGVDYPLKLYLHFFLKSQTQRLRGLNQGAAQPNLNTGIVKAIVVPLPPSTEQAEIVAEVDRRLSVADAAEKQVKHALQRAARLRQAILKRAFEGKLVPQDPTDEPAAALLERMKASGRVGSNGHRAVISNKNNGPATFTKRRSRARA